MSSSKLFASNAFHTPVGDLVAKATNSSLAKENWNLIFLVSDFIKVNPSCTKDAVKAIKKRLSKNQNFLQLNITLSLLEVCVKNCGIRFQEVVMTEKFILHSFLKIIESPNHPDVLLTRRVLGLIQDWAFTYQSNRKLKDVATVYNELKVQGCVFPLTKYPVSGQTQRPHASTGNKEQQSALQLPLPQLTKLRKDLSMVNSNINVLSTFLIELNPLNCEEDRYLLIKEISMTCRSMHQRIVNLFGRINDSGFNASLRSAVGDLNNVLLRYDRFEKIRISNEGLSLKTPSIHSDTGSFGSATNPPLEPHYEQYSQSSLYTQSPHHGHSSVTSATSSLSESTSSPIKHLGSCVYSLASDVENISMNGTIPPSVPAVSYPMPNDQIAPYKENEDQPNSQEMTLDAIIESLQEPYAISSKFRGPNLTPARNLALSTSM